MPSNNMNEFMQHTLKKDGNVTEQQRLEGQHEAVVAAMGKAIYAPIDFSKPGLKILDSGCANGRWLRDLAATAPAQHEFYGSDVVESLYPKDKPDNFHYRDWSIMDSAPEDWRGKFDLIHQRFVLAGAGPLPHGPIVQSFVSMLKSGGWLQLVELDTEQNPDSGPVLLEFMGVMRDMFAGMGAKANFAKDVKGELEKAGLEDVQEKTARVPYGATSKDKALGENASNGILQGIAPICAQVKSMPGVTKASDEQLSTMGTRMKEELATHGGICAVRVSWGRKP